MFEDFSYSLGRGILRSSHSPSPIPHGCLWLRAAIFGYYLTSPGFLILLIIKRGLGCQATLRPVLQRAPV